MASISVDIDIEDYLDEIDTDDLFEELESRNLTSSQTLIKSKFKILTEFDSYRDKMIDFFELHPGANIEDIIEKVKDGFYK